MGSIRSTFKRFLTAEEVPRWFGLSLVLIYLVGLGCVAHFGILQAKRETASHFQRSSRYAVTLLADRLSPLAGTIPAGTVAGLTDPRLAGAYRRELSEFVASIPARWLRVVDGDGRILASTGRGQAESPPRKIDGAAGKRPAGSAVRGGLEVFPFQPVGREMPDVLVRVRIPRPHRVGSPTNAASAKPFKVTRDGSGSTDAHEAALPRSRAAEPVLYLEARLPAGPLIGSSLADHARVLATVLVVLGALFVVYRCLREQLRGMSRIADRLRRRREGLEDDLACLRVGDTLDGVTASWNELIDLTQRLRDTAQRSEADEELSRVLKRSSGGALAEALNAVPDGIVYVTDEVRFEYVNAAACRLFGWSERDVAEKTLPEAKAAGVGGKVLDLLRDALQPDGSFEGRTETFDAGDAEDSVRSSYRVRVLPLHRLRQQGECVAVVRDVSQQVRAERAREDFITHVTHELRTPLTNIRAYAETLSSGMFEDPKVITECYNVITKETRRLSRLVEDVLSVSQMEVGTINAQIGDVDLKRLLGEGVRDVRGLADEKNIDLQLVLPSKLETIRADRDKLAVVINNLLGNAIKYTQPNGNVVVGCQFAGDEVILSIKDNGIGIDPSDHARVFEKFQRVSDPAVQNETGSGIGLHTAREIVRRHGGEIELISAKGQGSTFLVRLPHHETRAAAYSQNRFCSPTAKET